MELKKRSIFLGLILTIISVAFASHHSTKFQHYEDYEHNPDFADPGNLSVNYWSLNCLLLSENPEPIKKGRGLAETAIAIIEVFNPIRVLANLGLKLVDIGFRITKVINEQKEKNESKQGFFQGLAYTLFYEFEELCNVILFNAGGLHINQLDGVLHKTTVKYKTETWALYLVKGGSFVNANLDVWTWPTVSVAGDYSKPDWDITTVNLAFGFKTQIKLPTFKRKIVFNSRNTCRPA